MEKRKVAIIGCGALSSIIAGGIRQRLQDHYTLSGALDHNQAHAASFQQKFGCTIYGNIDAMLTEKPDIVIESAGVSAAKEYAEEILHSGSDMILMSVGALADDTFRSAVTEAATEGRTRLYVPNGAIGGLDLLQTMAYMGGIREMEIDNIKAPLSINGAPFLLGRNLPEDKEELVFSGSVQEAIHGFPKNVNVAVAASQAALYPDEKVVIRSQPGIEGNKHVIRVRSELVEAEISISSRPDPKNPKSSSSAAYSVLALLQNLASHVVYW